MSASLEKRILGSLTLAGIGDALGAPTEQCTQAEIAERFGGLVLTFEAPPAGTFAAFNAGQLGEVTDDASQLYYLARALIKAGGRLDPQGWIDCLLDWAATSGKAAFMGPSTAAALKRLQGAPEATSSFTPRTHGNTNGAAMRVAPCGLVHPGRIEAACEQAFITCLPSHDTDVAIASACAVATACAQALVSDNLDAVLAAAFDGARIGERIGRERARAIPGAKVSTRITMALDIAASASSDAAFLARTEAGIGTSVLAAESVPAAFGVLAYAGADPLRTVALAASIGNDTDTIATMAGAVAGAMRGADALPGTLVASFRRINDPLYDLDALAAGLAALAFPGS